MISSSQQKKFSQRNEKNYHFMVEMICLNKAAVSDQILKYGLMSVLSFLVGHFIPQHTIEGI